MARPEAIPTVRHIPLDELRMVEAKYDKQLKSYASIKRMRDRVCFIRMRYNGHSVEEAAAKIGFTTKTGYNIQESWNANGIEGLKPNFKGGPKSRLTDEQKDVGLFIKSEYDVEYSDKQIHVVLTRMGLHHSEPYPLSVNAHDTLTLVGSNRYPSTEDTSFLLGGESGGHVICAFFQHRETTCRCAPL